MGTSSPYPPKKHIEFAYDATERKYQVFSTSQKTLLAVIEWYPRWRKWVLVPDMDTIWDCGCLQTVIEYIQHNLPKTGPAPKQDQQTIL